MKSARSDGCNRYGRDWRCSSPARPSRRRDPCAGPGSDTAFLSPADQRTIAALPGARRVEFLRSQRLIVAPDRPPLALLARVVEAEGRVPPLLGAAHPLKPGDPPAAWVSEVASDIYGWKPGAVIELPLGGRNARFTVAGIWRDYARQQGAVLIERYEYLRHTGDAYANDAAVWLAPGADPASLAREIEARVAGGTNLEISGPGEIREVSLRIFDRTFAVTYALEAVAVVIGLFGLSSSFVALMLVLATFTAIASGRRAMSGEAVRAVKEDW